MKRKEEEGRLALREKEMREKSYAKGNEAKITTHWTKIMRQAKVRYESHFPFLFSGEKLSYAYVYTAGNFRNFF